MPALKAGLGSITGWLTDLAIFRILLMLSPLLYRRKHFFLCYWQPAEGTGDWRGNVSAWKFHSLSCLLDSL